MGDLQKKASLTSASDFVSLGKLFKLKSSSEKYDHHIINPEKKSCSCSIYLKKLFAAIALLTVIYLVCVGLAKVFLAKQLNFLLKQSEVD